MLLYSGLPIAELTRTSLIVIVPINCNVASGSCVTFDAMAAVVIMCCSEDLLGYMSLHILLR